MTERRASWVDDCNLKPNWTLDRRLCFERILEGKDGSEVGALGEITRFGHRVNIRGFQSKGKFLLS